MKILTFLLSLYSLMFNHGLFAQEAETQWSGMVVHSVKMLDCSTGEQVWIATGVESSPLEIIREVLYNLGNSKE